MLPSPCRDTPPEMYDSLVAHWQTMSPAERAALADRLSHDVAVVAEAGIRAQHPGFDDRAVARELMRRRYGAELADAVFDTTDAT